MKTLESGQDKIQKICDKLRRETLEPAKEEAQHIIAAAKKRADDIVAEAQKHADQILKQARSQIEQERSVFHSSLEQAAKQSLEVVRQEFENKFFNEELQTMLGKDLSNPKLIAQLVNGIVKALEKDGIAADISLVIPKTVAPEDVTALLIDSAQKRLKGKPIELGTFAGGIQVKLHGRRMTLDLTDQALKEMLANYARKDFRQYIFGG